MTRLSQWKWGLRLVIWNFVVDFAAMFKKTEFGFLVKNDGLERGYDEERGQ